jgi:hypothetical protein
MNAFHMRSERRPGSCSTRKPERVGRLEVKWNPTIKGEKVMASEKLRVTTFDTVALDDGDWDGPQHVGELLTYKSKHDLASIKVMRGATTVFDLDYGANKTVTIDGNVIHLPEGAKREV